MPTRKDLEGRQPSTWCPGCGMLLIERHGFRILRNVIPDGDCPVCGRQSSQEAFPFCSKRCAMCTTSARSERTRPRGTRSTSRHSCRSALRERAPHKR